MMFDKMQNLEGLPRKEREKLFKRHEIISAAVKLFANKGFEKTTLDEIAASSEFGKGTIYNYFKSKEEIFLAILEEISSNYFELLQEKFESTTTLRELVESVTKGIFEFYAAHPEEFILMHRIRNLSISFKPMNKSDALKSHFELIRQLYRKRIISAIENNEIRNVDIESLQLLMQSMFFGYMHQLHICGKLESICVDDQLNFVIDVLFKGIEIKREQM